MKNRAELLAFAGTSRTVLEARIVRLVEAIEAFEERVAVRRDSAIANADHPDPFARLSAPIRERAYAVVLADLGELLGESLAPHDNR
jgi:hypothetical protein